jgi:hypothetical protein
VLGAFAVLRRAKAPSDALPRSAVRNDLPIDGVGKLWVDYVRRVGQTPGGSPFFAVPVEFRLRLVSSCLRRLTPAARAGVIAVYQRYTRNPWLCLNDYDNGGQEACATASNAARGELVTVADDDAPMAPPPSSNGSGPILAAGLAPDGAASVTASYPNETVSAPVSNNFFEYVHQLVVPPGATSLPNLNPELVTYKREDGTVMLQAHPQPDIPTPDKA